MSGRDPKQRPEDGAHAETLNSPGFAATEPISVETPALGTDRLDAGPRLDEGELLSERYRVIRYVARGGMGEVYEAEDQALGERVALKTIRAESKDPAAEDRFKREIQLSRKVTHGNVCRIFDFGYHTGSDGERMVFLTMELLGGETLLELIRRDGPLPLADAAKIVRQIVAALTTAHQVGVVHRDLKSGNVILAPKKNGGTRAVVSDFGLAHVLTGDDGRSLGASESIAGGIVGTPGYMAPEQVEGGAITPRSDVYALGIVMYEMVTGRLPFEGATPLATAAKRLSMPAPSPRRLRADLTPRWERTILACLERDPKLRPASARAILEMLDEDAASTSLRVPRVRRRAQLVQTGIALAIMAVAVLIGLRAWHHRPHALGDELLRRGVTLGTFEPAGPGLLPAYGVLVRNAIRTDLAFDIPVIDARAEFYLEDGRAVSVGFMRAHLDGEPLRVEGSFSIQGDGADRRLELKLRLVDPRTNEQRAAIVESGALRHVEEVVLHAGDRLRAFAHLDHETARPLDAAGRQSLEAGLESVRDGDLARALEIVEEAQVKSPDTVELRYLEARILAGLEADVSSGVAIARATSLGPSSDEFWRERVNALRLRGDAVHSAQVLEDLYRKNAQKPGLGLDVAVDLGRVYLQAEHGDKAQELLERIDTPLLKPRERVRVANERLIVAQRLGRAEYVLKHYAEVREQARAVGLPGLEYQTLRIACEVSTAEIEVAHADLVCGEMRALAERLHLPAGITSAHTSWALARVANQVDPALLNVARQARALAIQLGGRRRIAEALHVFAIAARDTNAPEADNELFMESLAIARDAHDHLAATDILFDLAYYAQSDGRADDEERYLNESVEISRDSGSKELIATALCRLGERQARAGDLQGARRGLEEGLANYGRDSRSTKLDDCGLLQGIVDEMGGHYAEARGRYETLFNQHLRDGGDPEGRINYLDRNCHIDYVTHNWEHLIPCTSKLIEIAAHHGERSNMRIAMLMRANAQAALGKTAEARGLPRYLRDRDDSDVKLDRAWAELLTIALDRRLGEPTGDLGVRFDAVIATATAMRHRQIEMLARLEQLALLVRDRDPSAARVAKDVAARANNAGYVGLARLAQAVLHGGRI